MNFSKIYFEGLKCFEYLFKYDSLENIASIIRLSHYLPRFIYLEDNQALMEEVGKEELHITLQSFQKDKSLGPDGLPMELFLNCYDFIK